MKINAVRSAFATKITVLFYLGGLTGIAFSQQIPKGWRQFVSVEGGYTVYFPKSWYSLPPSLPTLRVGNFPPSRAVRAVVLPTGGADISILAPRSGITTVEQWIRSGGPPEAQIESRRSITLERPESRTPLRVAEVVSTSLEGQETVGWCFELSGRLLVANLSYWKGDPHAEKYCQVLRQMIQTIAPLPR